jgi:hypothetical protein
MNLFINYYDSSTRQEELDFCLKKNLANKLIKRIVIFNESKRVFRQKKVIAINVETRPTYQEFFDLTKDYPNDVNIITNTDIYFDETIKHAENVKENVCYALTRHEKRGDRLVPFEQAHNSSPKSGYSQDTWIFKGTVKSGHYDTVLAIRTSDRRHDEIKFTMGVPGCDNILAFLLKQSYQVLNPGTTIRCIHNHANEGRPVYTHRMTGDLTMWGKIHQGFIPITGL